MPRVYVNGQLKDLFRKPLLITALERLSFKHLEDDDMRLYTKRGHAGWRRARTKALGNGSKFNYQSGLGRDSWTNNQDNERVPIRSLELRLSHPITEKLTIQPTGERYQVVIERSYTEDTVTVYKEFTHTVRERTDEGTRLIHNTGDKTDKRSFRGINSDTLDKTVLAHVQRLLPSYEPEESLSE